MAQRPLCGSLPHGATSMPVVESASSAIVLLWAAVSSALCRTRAVADAAESAAPSSLRLCGGCSRFSSSSACGVGEPPPRSETGVRDPVLSLPAKLAPVSPAMKELGAGDPGAVALAELCGGERDSERRWGECGISAHIEVLPRIYK